MNDHLKKIAVISVGIRETPRAGSCRDSKRTVPSTRAASTASDCG
jgi:hypothetical protein